MFSLIILITLVSVTTSLKKQIIDGVKCDCIKSIKCKQWLSAINSGQYLQLPVCGFDERNFQPLICCPRDDEPGTNKIKRFKREVVQGQKNIQLSCTITSQTLTPAEVATNKCNEYSKEVLKVFEVSEGDGPYQKQERDTCLKNDEKSAEPREFPHMALLGFDKNESISWLCGGSLISERYVLTAAHCAETRSFGGAKWIKLGEFDISTDTDVAMPKIYSIFDIIIHPDYKSFRLYHDIALIKLNKDVEFNIFIRPACLFTKRDIPDDKAFAVGYGRKHFSGETSEVPKKIELQIENVKKCNAMFNDSRQLPDGITPDLMICAKEIDQSDVVCAGDSGGPLQISLKKPYCTFAIIGVTSFGKGCGMNVPGVSTRVAHYLPWIVQNVWPDDL